MEQRIPITSRLVASFDDAVFSDVLRRAKDYAIAEETKRIDAIVIAAIKGGHSAFRLNETTYVLNRESHRFAAAMLEPRRLAGGTLDRHWQPQWQDGGALVPLSVHARLPELEGAAGR